MAKYLYEKTITTKTEFKIETLSGVKEVNLIVENKTVIGVRVNMGIPYFEAQKIPAFLPKEEAPKKFHTIEIENQGEKYKFDLVSIGNPHAVCFVEDLAKIDVKTIGSLVENYKYFPNKINVEFVQVLDRNNIKIKVWERGVGQTISCGTGACASAVCSEKRNLCDFNINVELEGGKLRIDYDKEKGIFLTGSAEFTFEGRLNF
jgi:diaminopimelate epimerase